MNVEINPQLLHWAIERSMKSEESLRTKYPNLLAWQNKTKQPTLKQLERFAKATFTPVGMFFLKTLPDEVLPIRDFRTLPNGEFSRPSANLLDTIYICQQRQEWYRSYCRQQQLDELPFVGKYNITHDPKTVAKELTEIFSFHNSYNNLQKALSGRTTLIEKQGVLVMSSGVALGNTHRDLRVEEFRGFALSDAYAPVLFINAKDSMNARHFTLIHELAHIAIAQDGVSNTNSYDKTNTAIERWCNTVAAEILVPSDKLEQEYQHHVNNLDQNQKLQDIAKCFRVSTLVILGRMRDLGYIDKNDFWQLFGEEKEKLQKLLQTQKPKGTGGNYYHSKTASVSKAFAETITASVLEGKTLYREAMQLLNIKSIKTFNKLTSKIHPWSA